MYSLSPRGTPKWQTVTRTPSDEILTSLFVKTVSASEMHLVLKSSHVLFALALYPSHGPYLSSSSHQHLWQRQQVFAGVCLSKPQTSLHHQWWLSNTETTHLLMVSERVLVVLHAHCQAAPVLCILRWLLPPNLSALLLLPGCCSLDQPFFQKAANTAISI